MIVVLGGYVIIVILNNVNAFLELVIDAILHLIELLIYTIESRMEVLRERVLDIIKGLSMHNIRCHINGQNQYKYGPNYVAPYVN
jgi:hypothetical protein